MRRPQNLKQVEDFFQSFVAFSEKLDFNIRGRSQTTFTRRGRWSKKCPLFVNIHTIEKSTQGARWSKKPESCLVNVVCERPLIKIIDCFGVFWF